MRITILGKRWTLRFVPTLGKNLWGKCTSPDEPHREITVSLEAKGEMRLDTIVHELIHASGWHIDEDYVERFASDVARTLWRLGYRNVNEA